MSKGFADGFPRHLELVVTIAWRIPKNYYPLCRALCEIVDSITEEGKLITLPAV
jgi:hypothetical protein